MDVNTLQHMKDKVAKGERLLRQIKNVQTMVQHTNRLTENAQLTTKVFVGGSMHEFTLTAKQINQLAQNRLQELNYELKEL